MKKLIILIGTMFYICMVFPQGAGISAKTEKESDATKETLSPQAIKQAFEEALSAVEAGRAKEQKQLLSELESKLNLAIEEWISSARKKKDSELNKLLQKEWQRVSEKGPPIRYRYHLRDYAYVVVKTDILKTDSLATLHKAIVNIDEKLYVERYHSESVSYPEKYLYTVTTPITINFEYQRDRFMVRGTEHKEHAFEEGWPEQIKRTHWSLLHTITVSYADITTESFSAWSGPMGSVGIENFQHDKFSGAVAYTIPLEVVRGTNEMQPELKLRYFSGNGNSMVGVGWSIDLGMVTRSMRLGKPNFNDKDIFVLQLNDLVSELVSIGAGQYRTKTESYLRITKSGGSWVVEDRDGTRYEFNYNVADLAYYLTKITDTHGNYVEISYFSSDNVGYINQITYTKGSSLSRYRTIEFFYEDRTDNYPDSSIGKTLSIISGLITLR